MNGACVPASEAPAAVTTPGECPPDQLFIEGQCTYGGIACPSGSGYTLVETYGYGATGRILAQGVPYERVGNAVGLHIVNADDPRCLAAGAPSGGAAPGQAPAAPALPGQPLPAAGPAAAAAVPGGTLQVAAPRGIPTQVTQALQPPSGAPQMTRPLAVTGPAALPGAPFEAMPTGLPPAQRVAQPARAEVPPPAAPPPPLAPACPGPDLPIPVAEWSRRCASRFFI